MRVRNDICRYMPQASRAALYGQPIPEGMRLGSLCKINCDHVEHFCIVPDGNYGKKNWKPYKARFLALSENEFVDFPDYPNNQTAIRELNANLTSVAGMWRFVIRSLPRQNGVRVIRCKGRAYDGRRVPDLLREHPLLCFAKRPVDNDWHGFYLGFMRNPGINLGPCKSRCSIKGCPYPATAAALVCRQHTLAEWELQFSRELDQRDMLAPKEHPWVPVTLYRNWIGYDRTGFLHTQTYWAKQKTFQKKSLAEKQNDKWWQENVIDKGLITDADGVLHQMNSEREMNATIGLKESQDNIARYFGLQTSGTGKMRLGGGRGKIRKKQRRRPAGWYGHRDDTKSNKPDRETIECSSEEWEFEDDGLIEEDDYSEDSAA